MKSIRLRFRDNSLVKCAIALCGVAAAAIGHFAWRGAAMDTHGPVLVIDHFFDVLIVGILLILCVGSGHWLLRRAGIELDDPAESLALCGVCGMGLIATALLIVCLELGVNGLSVAVVLTGVTSVSLKEVASAPRLVTEATREALLVRQGGCRRLVPVLGFAALVLMLTSLSHLPPVDWDSLAYQLQVPREWLAVGRVFLPSDNLHLAYVGVNNLLYVPLLVFGSSSGPQLFNLALFLLLPFGVFAAARQIGGQFAGRVAFWLCFCSPILLITGITPMVDVTLALVLIVTHLAALRSIQGAGDAKLLVLSAALVGVGGGVKYSGFLYGVALVPLYVVALVRIGKRSRKVFFRTLGLAILAFGVAAAPWSLKNAILLGNPVYPFGSTPRVEPWLKPLYPDLRPAGVDPGAFTVITTMREPFSLWRFLFAPATITSNANANHEAPFWMLFFAPFALLGKRRWAASAFVGPPVAFAAMLLGISPYTNLRYLIPVIPGLTVGAAIALTLAWDRLSRSARYLLVIVTTILAAPSAVAIHALMDQAKPWRFAAGRESRDEYLARYWETASLMPAVHWVHDYVPEGQNVIMLFESRGFYFDREVRGDINIRNWPFLAAFAHAPGCLTQVGASFILVNDGSRKYYLRRGHGMPSLQWDAFEAFRRECLSLRYDQKGIRIFEVSSDP